MSSERFEPVNDRIETDETVRVDDETTIDVHLTRPDGANVDLTDQTVTAVIEDSEYHTVVNREATIANATGGELTVTTEDGDFPAPGLYYLSLEITDQTNRSVTAPTDDPLVIEAVRRGGA